MGRIVGMRSVQPIVEMHHEMKFRLGGGTKDPAVWQNCLDRSGIAYEKERASRAVIPFRQVDLARDGAAIFVVIPLGESDRWSIVSFGCCHSGPFSFL
jgi:hypothetical protein